MASQASVDWPDLSSARHASVHCITMTVCLGQAAQSELQCICCLMQGLTGSIAVCAALQGGQFMFTNILLGYTTGKGKVQSTTLWRGRLYFFAFLVVSTVPHSMRPTSTAMYHYIACLNWTRLQCRCCHSHLLSSCSCQRCI